MKKNQYFYLILIALACNYNIAFSQQISINDNVSIQQLIEDNLVEGCVEISNVISTVNGAASGFSSFAEFDRAGSNFPFQNGIMLSTGNAVSGGNTLNTELLSEGSNSWGSDADLETALGISNTLNATSIEFDFISISNQLSFNYLLASEEYTDVNPCFFADGFAFLIRETGSTAPYQNIALIPGTSTPVNTSTVRDEVVGVCDAANDEFFAGQNLGDTNYNGRTTVLTASTSIIPYVQYHIKLVIADQGNDRTLDSAVFIEGDSFKILDLGDDITTCSSSVTLDANINNPTSTYQWFLNNATTPISGATNPTLVVTQTGIYRVEITNQLNDSSTCIEEDEIIVTLSSEENINTISDFELCDDLSGNQIESFDLSTKDDEIANVVAEIPFTNFSHSYHFSDSDARSNSGAITLPIQNSINPQPIFVRIEDLDSGCFAYTSFNLVVNIIPNITAPSTLEECDSDSQPDGLTLIDLTQKDDEITGGIANFVVSYHFNQVDSTTGNNPIPDPTVYQNTNPSDNLFIRVVNTQTGCFNISTLTVDVTTSPIVSRETEFLDACDQDHDGSATFNLTDAIPNILDGLTDAVTVTFHESFDEANNDENPIANSTNYQNITPDVQVIFVRIEDNITGCASITFLEIHTNLLITATNTGDFALCDDESNDGIVNFNLAVIETQIANDLPNIVVNFFETQTNLDNNIAIPKNISYPASNPTTLLITIDNGICSEVEEINLVVNPVLIFNQVTPQEYCDDDDDGIISIELATFDDLITGGNTDFGVRYYPTQIDAEQNLNQLPPFYQNTNPIETLFTRIENADSGCSTIKSFEIQIISAPTITNPSPFLICDDDDDGLSIVNLNSKISEIVTNPSGLNINFFTDINDAETNNNPIPVSERAAYNTNTQTIFVRIENATTLCYDITTLEIIVNTLPVFDTISNFQTCEDDGDNRAQFLFSNKDAEILNGQTGKEVLYFEDAAFTAPIDKNMLYTNIASPQTIYIRVQNITDPNCFGTDMFTIEVGANPVYTSPTPFLECDDVSNDAISVFDLNEKINEINQNGTQNNNITFHLNSTDAENNNNPQPLLFTNTVNPQQLFARIVSNGSQCAVIEGFGINIVSAPNLSDAQPIEQCDTDYDGQTIFNLENAQYDNFDRIQTGIEVYYFENESDVENNTLSISNPTIYVSGSKTIFIKVLNTFTTCYTVLPLELIVNPPPSINFIDTIAICDNETNTYNLLDASNLFVNNPDIVNISYHNSNNDAINNLNPITQNIFNYTASNHTFFIRVENPQTNCIITTSFILQINQNPTANNNANIVECDDDFDGFKEIDLSQNDSFILGAQTTTNFSVYYYNDVANAENDTNRLNNLLNAFNAQTIFARVQNTTTGCFVITQFNIIIHPLPVIPINDIEPLCLDDLPMVISANTGNITDSYLWDTGQTTPEVTFQTNNLGMHWVEVTTQNNCSLRKEFNLIESEKATITLTPTVNFADPNSITVNIQSNTRGNYVYILDETNGGEPQISNIFNNVTFGRHFVTVRDLNGCMDETREVFVFDIPKFTTPNNDGNFDTWHIVGANQLPGTVVYIFNRHGKLLKTLLHNSQGWNGTFNGQNMPSDDYWFSADIIQNGEAFNIKGHFALKR